MGITEICSPGSVLTDRTVYKLQVFYEILPVLASYIFNRVSNLMNDGELYARFWECALDRIRKLLKTIHTSYENIIHIPILKVGENT